MPSGPWQTWHSADEKLLAKDAAVKVEDGKYTDASGSPTFHVTDNGKNILSMYGSRADGC
jgi:hypothetical protein